VFFFIRKASVDKPDESSVLLHGHRCVATISHNVNKFCIRPLPLKFAHAPPVKGSFVPDRPVPTIKIMSRCLVMR
jgi:hypothetical protein